MSVSKEDLISFEKSVADLWEAGKINAPVHLSSNNEDQLIEIFKEIKHDDYIFSSHRNHYHALLHDIKPDSLLEEIMGNQNAICKGRARSMGFIDYDNNFYSSAIVGGCCALAVGVAWALKQKQDQFKNDPLNTDEFAVKPPDRHVWIFCGDGVVDGGHFWEALQYARGWELPIKFIIEDNNRATCTTLRERLGNVLAIYMNDDYVKTYQYNPTYPHVGTGKYIQF